MKHVVCLDFETASACNLKKAGEYRYAEDITTEVLCARWSINGEISDIRGWVPANGYSQELADLAADPEVIFDAHKASFEKQIWREIMVAQFGYPPIPNARWDCTLACCAMKVLPQDLDGAALVLRLAHQKDKEGSKITVALSKPNKKGFYLRDPAVLQRTYDYCGHDIESEVGLRNRIGTLPSGERNVWLLNQRINERGIRLDMDYVRAAQSIVDRASGPLLREFADLTGGLKPTQGAKFIEWCGVQGFRPDNLQKETLAAILGGSVDDVDDADDQDDGDFEMGPADPADMPDNVCRALTIRQLVGSSSVKKLRRMEDCVCADGRARGLLQYHGTGPGRSAGRLLQPQNFPRGTLKIDGVAPKPDLVVSAIMTGDPDYVAALIGPPIETVVSGLRHAIVADRDRVLLSGDYAGIQARVVLAVAGQHDKTKVMATPGADIYCDMASQIYKRPIDRKKDPAERQTGKNSVLGLGFQMGWKKFRFKYAQEETEEFCEKIVRVYRKEWAPKVPYLWYGLEDAAVATVWDKTPHEAYGVTYALEDGWLTARLPSGRKLWYFNPQPVRRAMPYDPTIVKRAFTYNVRKMGQWRTIDAFGGQLTENVVMGIERDIMVGAMFRCEKNGFPVCMEVHDEIVAEPKKEDADVNAFTQIMLDVPDWVRHIQIPIAIDTWTGDRYKK